MLIHLFQTQHGGYDGDAGHNKCTAKRIVLHEEYTATGGTPTGMVHLNQDSDVVK